MYLFIYLSIYLSIYIYITEYASLQICYQLMGGKRKIP